MRSIRSNSWRFVAVLLIAAGGLGLAACFATAEETVSKTVEVGKNTEIRVRSANGRIEVTAGSEGKVQLKAIKKTRAFSSPRRLLKDIHIKVDQSSGVLTIAAEHPSSSMSRMYGVEFRLEVPPTSRLDLLTKNGSVRLGGVKGEVKAETKNGSIKAIDAVGKVRLLTMNGSIKARGAITDLVADTRNGSIGVSIDPAPSVPPPRTARPAARAAPRPDPAPSARPAEGPAATARPATARPAKPRPAKPRPAKARPEPRKSDKGNWKSFDGKDGAKTEKPKEAARPPGDAPREAPPRGAPPTAARPATPKAEPKQGAKVVLKSRNGSIRLSGVIRSFAAETRNGSVKVILDPGSALEGPSRADTKNGSITFKVPAGFGCVIEARTSLGSVKSDFPLEQKSKKTGSGTIGGGGPRVTLTTSNGSIRIRQR